VEVYIQEATKKTPKIILDADEGYFEMSGVAMPEDTVLFFSPLMKKIKEYIEACTQPISFNFYIYYYNSLSSKKLYDMFRLLESYAKANKDITVIWNYEEDDECMEDAGTLFKETLDLAFEMRKLEE
jgi:hypothetical protein